MGKKIRKIILVLLILSIVGVGGYFGYRYWINQSEPESELPVETVLPTVDPAELLADEYDPIYDEYYALNTDYVGYLEWENELLYDYDEDTPDQYPHVIVKSHMMEDGEGDVNDGNAEYLRKAIDGSEVSFGQEFMDASNKLDENNIPTDQNLIIYGHYVYEYRYGTTDLKFTPLNALTDPEVYEDYDTFTLTFNGQQRTYQVAHAFYYNLNWFDGNRMNSPLATNYDEEKLIALEDNIENQWNDFIDEDIHLESDDHFVTLQTCVEGTSSEVFIVIGKEISRVNF